MMWWFKLLLEMYAEDPTSLTLAAAPGPTPGRWFQRSGVGPTTSRGAQHFEHHSIAHAAIRITWWFRSPMSCDTITLCSWWDRAHFFGMQFRNQRGTSPAYNSKSTKNVVFLFSQILSFAGYFFITLFILISLDKFDHLFLYKNIFSYFWNSDIN